jgi:histidinol-phosphate phosphatase family protein
MNIDQAVIFCGGKGLRLKNYTKKIPKPMVMVNRKPFLYHLLTQLKNQGIKEFLILTGYKSKLIKSFFGNGSKFGIKVNYSWAPENWETSKRLLRVEKKLKKNFLICYSDNYFNFNLKKNLKKFEHSDLTLSLIKRLNGNIKIYGQDFFYNNDRNKKGYNYIELGYILAKKNIIKFFKSKLNKPISYFFNQIFKKKKISFVNVNHYHSISNIKRLKLTRGHFSGKKILLLDRDGTINLRLKKGQYIKNIKQLKFLNKTIKFLQILSKKNFSFIIITNQAGVGRGLISESKLNKIHKFMLEELGRKGIKIIKIYVCKHHWLDNCICRKPKPHMIIKSINDHNLEKKKILFIGDDIRDWETAKKAGCNYLHMTKIKNIKNKLYKGDMYNQNKAIKIIDEIYS